MTSFLLLSTKQGDWSRSAFRRVRARALAKCGPWIAIDLASIWTPSAMLFIADTRARVGDVLPTCSSPFVDTAATAARVVYLNQGAVARRGRHALPAIHFGFPIFDELSCGLPSTVYLPSGKVIAG